MMPPFAKPVENLGSSVESGTSRLQPENNDVYNLVIKSVIFSTGPKYC